jgi:endonuclease III
MALQPSLKRPFDLDAVFDLVREAVAPYPPAAMFQLADEGYISAFEQLVACIISIRTMDEVSLVVARDLFAVAREPDAVAELSSEELGRLIARSSYAETKVGWIIELARRTRDEFGGVLPCDPAVFQSFNGVGPKCAHLAVGVACGVEEISVDVHVHRITNRWGLVQENTPEQTMKALEQVLPKKYWIEINRLLVPFGKHVCKGMPRCSVCPVVEYCRQVGVTRHR